MTFLHKKHCFKSYYESKIIYPPFFTTIPCAYVLVLVDDLEKQFDKIINQLKNHFSFLGHNDHNIHRFNQTQTIINETTI
jgi:hypothetical protein